MITHRIGIDAVGCAPGGGMHILQSLLEASAKIDPIVECVVFCGTSDVYNCVKNAPNCTPVLIASPIAQLPGRLLWWEILLEKAATRFSCNSVLLLSGIGFCRKTPTVSFVQQALPFCEKDYSQSFPLVAKAKIGVLRQLIFATTRRSALTIVQTAYLRKRILSAVDVQPSQVITLSPQAPVFFPGEGNADEKSRERNLHAGIYIGTRTYYKRDKSLIEAVRLLRRRAVPLTIYVTGTESQWSDALDVVTPIGHLGRQQICDALKSSAFLVQTSICESLGLPLLEAMRVGTAVIAADVEYAHEACGDAGLYFQPDNPEDLAAKIRTLLVNHDLRNALVANGLKRVSERDRSDAYREMILCTANLQNPARGKTSCM